MRGLLWLWAPVVGLMALIFWLSSQPSLAGVDGPFTDKQQHALAYGVLASLWYRALAGGRWDGLTGWRAVAAALAATVYGASDEWHQRFVPLRSAEFADLVADAVGASCAAAALWACGIIAARRRRLRAGTPRDFHQSPS